jgi:hypothetical protein
MAAAARQRVDVVGLGGATVRGGRREKGTREGGRRGECARRVNARRGGGKGEPMELS